MGASVSRFNPSETPPPAPTLEERVADADRALVRPPARALVFGDAAPTPDALWHALTPPTQYAECHGPQRHYRVPGTAFGVLVGRHGGRVLLRAVWPREGWYVSAEDADPVPAGRVVVAVSPPAGWTRPPFPPQHVALPLETEVTFADGRVEELGALDGGLQRNVCMCFMSQR